MKFDNKAIAKVFDVPESILFDWSFGGIKVVECEWLTTIVSRDRSWRERFFTRPWTPWVSYKFIEMPYFIELDGVVYAHPDVAQCFFPDG